jgi:L-gulonolactone oxidase
VTAVRSVVDAVESSGMRIAFPVELRVAAADDIPLSTASGRDSAYVAVHVPAGTDFGPYFDLVARVLDPYGGRPHWGKLHTLGASEIKERYPRFDEFVAIRDRVDPEGLFTNGYLDRVLGPPPEAHVRKDGTHA